MSCFRSPDVRNKTFFFNIPTYLNLINSFLSNEYANQLLGKHIKVFGGFAFKSSEYKSEGIPVIRISDFNDEKIDLSDVKYYEERPELEKYSLKQGDIIIALTGGTIGKLGIVQKGLGKLYLNQRVGKFYVLDSEDFFDEYIYWIARGVQDKIKAFGYGGAQPNISGTQIEELKFPIPNVATQKSIVSFLNDLRDNTLENREYFDMKTEGQIKKLQCLQEKIFTANNRLIMDQANIQELRQAILQEAVSGRLVPQDPNDEPASELLRKVRSEKEELIKEKKIKRDKPLPPITKEEIPYDLPKGWEWVRLGEIRHDWGQKIPDKKFTYIDVSSINKEKGFVENLSQQILPQDAPSRARKIVRKGTVIYSCVRPYLLNTSIITDNIEPEPITSTAFAILHPLGGIDPEYLHYFLRSQVMIDFVNSKMVGIAYPAISDSDFYKGLFPLPPLSEQRRIVEKVDQLIQTCDELETKVKENQKYSEDLMNAISKEAFEFS